MILFDGCTLLTPIVHPEMDMKVLPVIGRILSYAFLACGFLPLQITFPSLVSMLLGLGTFIPDKFLLDTFPDCLSGYERDTVREALNCSSLTEMLKTKLIAILSRFGCRVLPVDLKETIIRAARYHFLVKPIAAITLINTGIPSVHAPYWAKHSIETMQQLYLALTATPAKVLKVFVSEASNESEERVFGYLEQYVGSMSQDFLRKFLRFTTGSSVCIASKITVAFNSLSGLARCPIGHTCDSLLELPSSYLTYLEFVTEFDQVLSQPEHAWLIDAL